MKRLVTKKSHDWLILRKNKASPLFSSHQVFARFIMQRSCKLTRSALKTEDLSSGSTLEYVYPVCIVRTEIFRRISNKTYSIHKYYTTNLSFLHNTSFYVQEKCFFQIGRQNRRVTSDTPENALQSERALSTLDKLYDTVYLPGKSINTAKEGLLYHESNMPSLNNIRTWEQEMAPGLYSKSFRQAKYFTLIHTSSNRILQRLIEGAENNRDVLSLGAGREPVSYHEPSSHIPEREYSYLNPAVIIQPPLLANNVLQRYLGSKDLRIIKGPELAPYNKPSLHILELNHSYLTRVSAESISANPTERETKKAQIVSDDRKSKKKILYGLSSKNFMQSALSDHFKLVHTSHNTDIDREYTYHRTDVQGNGRNVGTVRTPLPVSRGVRQYQSSQTEMTVLSRKTLTNLQVIEGTENDRRVSSLRPEPEPALHYKPSSHIPELEYSYLNLTRVSSESIATTSGESETEKIQTVSDDRKRSIQKIPGVYQGEDVMDINRLADQVYRAIEKKMQIENERSGRWY